MQCGGVKVQLIRVPGLIQPLVSAIIHSLSSLAGTGSTIWTLSLAFYQSLCTGWEMGIVICSDTVFMNSLFCLLPEPLYEKDESGHRFRLNWTTDWIGLQMQGWNSEFGSNKERKKDFRQGKKTPGKDFNKSEWTSFATKCDKIMHKSVGKFPIQKCVSVCRDKMRQKMRKYVGKCPIQKCQN